MGVWTVGIEAWVIQDGNYEEFLVGRRYDFQVEALPLSVNRSEVAEVPRLRHVEHERHEFSGAVLKFHGHGAWVIDFGIYCYGKTPLPEGLRIGDTLAGEVSFFLASPTVYEQAFETEAPFRTYSWRVEVIHLDTTPWVEEGVVRRRDLANAGYVGVQATNALADDPTAFYLLDCTLLGRRGRAWLATDHLRRSIQRRVRRELVRRQRPGTVFFPPVDSEPDDIRPPDAPEQAPGGHS
jgi:hypothetical protein